jgi:hypothetical protein
MNGRSIGTLREQQYHASLKTWLAKPGDMIEQKVGGYHIDILRQDLVIEIQTGNFTKLRTKLLGLLDSQRVLVVYPIALTKWIVRQTKRGRQISRRRSPKRGRVEHLFDELLYIAELVRHPNFNLLVLFTEQEEIWRDDGRGSWRRKHWSIADKRLLAVDEGPTFTSLGDYLQLVPAGLPDPFTHRELADALNAPLRLSTRMSYCLRKMGCLETRGKSGRALLLSPVSH